MAEEHDEVSGVRLDCKRQRPVDATKRGLFVSWWSIAACVFYILSAFLLGWFLGPSAQ